MELVSKDIVLDLPNESLADHLFEIYKYYELDRDTYRAKTFKEASDKIKIYPDLIVSGKDAKEKIGTGIGPSTMEVIDQFIQTGTSERYNDLKNRYQDREKVIELFRTIHGVGPVTANKFYDAGYRTFDDLWSNVNLTNAQQLTILYRLHLAQRIPRKEMDLVNESFKRLFSNIEYIIVGSYRRGEPNSGDIDILIKSSGNVYLSDIVNTLKKYDTIRGDLAQGESKYLGLFQLPGGNVRRLDLLIIDPKSWASALMYFTGSQRFNILMRSRAIELGMRLNEYGLFDSQGYRIDSKSEEDIFDTLGVRYMEPEERKKDLVRLELL
jgi:DNA polymerase/3'-5' exonuclease PolX